MMDREQVRQGLAALEREVAALRRRLEAEGGPDGSDASPRSGGRREDEPAPADTGGPAGDGGPPPA